MGVLVAITRVEFGSDLRALNETAFSELFKTSRHKMRVLLKGP